MNHRWNQDHNRAKRGEMRNRRFGALDSGVAIVSECCQQFLSGAIWNKHNPKRYEKKKEKKTKPINATQTQTQRKPTSYAPALPNGRSPSKNSSSRST
mmetsp:Transcript_20261/g.47489  ORF Transcript_20261/g.47489 Transcript_20261/m.47489 type:complete len:98 (-) Transcript_20261:550-843(-)